MESDLNDCHTCTHRGAGKLDTCSPCVNAAAKLGYYINWKPSEPIDLMKDYTLEEPKQVGGNHYLKAGSNMQPWDISLAWQLNGWEMNVLKYLLRHKYKNREQDIDKAIHYLEFIRDNYEELYEPK